MNQLKTVKSFGCTFGFVLSFLSTLFVFSVQSFADPNIASGSNSATCNDSTLETYSGTSNLSANWGANTISLHWYEDSESTTELTGSGIPTSCVYDGTLTLPAPLEKEGYTFAGWKVRGLPDGYTKLQYVIFNGTQYINTGWKPNQNTEIRAKYMVTTTGSRWVYGSGSSNPRITAYVASGASNQRFGSQTLTRTIPVNTINESIQNKQGLTLNGEFTAYPTVANFTSTGTFMIGTASTSSSTAKFVGYIYYLRVYNSGVLKFNFIPAKNSNNVVGLYDTVTKTFFTDSGNGSLDAGPVAQ